MLKTVLFATLRFHDTTSRGRLLNRFGKDIEGLDSSMADNCELRYSPGREFKADRQSCEVWPMVSTSSLHSCQSRISAAGHSSARGCKLDITPGLSS